MKEKLLHFIINIAKSRPALLVVALLIVVCLVVWLFSAIRNTTMRVAVDDKIELTPTQIQSVRSIGQWEFLAVSDEELVDTVRKRFFSDDQLARIYYGTLRLGVDLQEAKEGWMVADGDTIRVLMPPVKLLDNRFIDEARTRSFYESGRWSAADREQLYQKAHRQMLQHALTAANLQRARENGEVQMRRLLRSMGFDAVEIRYEE